MMHGFTSADWRVWRRVGVWLGALLAVVSVVSPGLLAQGEPVRVTLDLLEPPLPPFRAVALVTRTSGPGKDTTRQIRIGDGGAGINAGMRMHVEDKKIGLRVIEDIELGDYSVVIRAFGFKDSRPKTIKLPGKPNAQFEKLEPLKTTLVISGGSDGIEKPQIRRAIVEWNPKTTTWDALPGQFEPTPLPLTPARDNTGNFTTVVAPGRYQVTVQALLTGSPLTREVTVGNDRTVLAFSPEELQKKPTLTFSVVTPRAGERFHVRAVEGIYTEEILPGQTLTLPKPGLYEMYWTEAPGKPPVLVARDDITPGLDRVRTLQPLRFNKGAVWIDAASRLALEFLDADNRRIEPFAETVEDKKYFWLPAEKPLKWRARHESGVYSAVESLPALKVYTWDYALILPSEDEFTSGKLAVTVQRRDETKIPEMFLQFLSGGRVTKEIPLTQSTQDVTAPIGSVEVRAVALLPDGKRRQQKTSKTVRVAAAASGEAAEVVIDAAQFHVGSLTVMSSGFSTPPTLSAQKLTGEPQRTTLNGETLVSEGAWRVTAEADGKRISKEVQVTFENPGVWNISADSFKQGMLALYTTTNDRSKITLRRADGAGEPVPMPTLSDVQAELSLLSKVYRADFGKFDSGIVQGGLDEGAWIVSAFGREIRFQIRGAARQAVVLTEQASAQADLNDRVRNVVPLASLLGEGAVANAGPTGATKQGATTPDTALANKTAVQPWSPGQSVTIEVEGRSLSLNWVPSINGWMATTTVANEKNLPRAFSYAEARALIEQLNADENYKARRDEYVFALPKLQDWQRTAGTRSRDQIAEAIGRGLLDRVDAAGDRNGFSHLYGNVWQWVQPEKDANGREVLRVVGGSFITTPDSMPENGVSLIKTDRRRDNIGLRIALLKP